MARFPWSNRLSQYIYTTSPTPLEQCPENRRDFKVEHGGLNDVTKHSVTESTELNPGCQQPFLFGKMSSPAKTSCQEIRCKEGCKIQKKH